MEWEYLEGRLGVEHIGRARFIVFTYEEGTDQQKKQSMNQLGSARWELVTCAVVGSDVLLMFKRQKLYEVGNDHR